jgi:hypothetical protein
MDVETPGTGRGDAPAGTYAERGYPQFDCLGCYTWIWERLVLTEGRTEVDARHIRRDHAPHSPQPS